MRSRAKLDILNARSYKRGIKRKNTKYVKQQQFGPHNHGIHPYPVNFSLLKATADFLSFC